MTTEHADEIGPGAARRPLHPAEALAGSRGAFDLPSILTGVVVVGVLTAGVLASVFGVIPFAQDRGAKQDLDAVRTAEGVAKAKDSAFVSSAALISSQYLPSGAKIAAGTDESGSCYTAVALSGSGRMYYAESTAPTPLELTDSARSTCVTENALRTLIDQAGGNSSSRPPATPAAPVLTSYRGPGEWAGAEWAEAERATSYRVERNFRGRGWTSTSGVTALKAQDWLYEGDTYEYRVYAVNASGESPASNIITAHRVGFNNTLTNSKFDNGATGWTITGPHTINPVHWLDGWGNMLHSSDVVTVSQSVAATAGERMIASVDIQNQQYAASMTLRFYDAAGVEIPGTAQETALAPSLNVKTIGGGEITSPAGTASAKLTVVTGEGNASVDNLQLFAWR